MPIHVLGWKLQGNLRQDEFPSLSGGPQGGQPDPAAYGRHPAYDEDDRHFMQPLGDSNNILSLHLCSDRQHVACISVAIVQVCRSNAIISMIHRP